MTGSPHPLFDSEWYLQQNPDVAAAGINPLQHYMAYGWKEGRDPNPMFDTSFYIENNPDIAAQGVNPLTHFVQYGWKEGRTPHPNFKPHDFNVRGTSIKSEADFLEWYTSVANTEPRNISSIEHLRPASEADTSSREHAGTGGQISKVVYISGIPDSASHIYRVEHQVDLLNSIGITSEWIDVAHLSKHRHRVLFSEVAVFFRVAWDDAIADIFSGCRAAGVTILFDIDDYVFDLDVANEHHVDGLRYLNPNDLPQYYDGVRRYRLTAENADGCIVTTDFLANAFIAMGKPCSVIRNGFSNNTHITSEAARHSAARTAREQIRLGYASGSMTHQRDFGEIASVIADLLSQHANVYLTVVGLLNLSEFPELLPHSHRIEIRPLVPHSQLPFELARFDINLAPLQKDNPYCEAKSELKYYEAALLNIPTVATATSTFRHAITHGKTGFLAQTKAEWRALLEELVANRTMRESIGSAAHTHALEAYSPGAKQVMIRTLFEDLLIKRRQTLEQNIASYSQTITFVVPGMIKGSGGHNKIISIAKLLASSGYTVLLTFTGPTADYPSPGQIAEDLDLDRHNIRVVYSAQVPATTNITIATYWATVYNVEKSQVWCGRRYHLLQDYEPYFFPMSTDYLLAVNAMQKEYEKISYGPWVKRIIADRHNLTAQEMPFYIDKDTYHTRPEISRKHNRVLFFARPDMPRRCFDLGVEALKAYQAKYGFDTEIIFFGSYAVANIGLDLSYVDLTVLSPTELACIYNEATVGLVFSPTNPSMVPFEMMACGLPVIDLDVEGNAENYGDRDNAYLVNPDPDEIADFIARVLRDKGDLQQVRQNAQAFAAKMSSEDDAISALIKIIDPSRPHRSI